MKADLAWANPLLCSNFCKFKQKNELSDSIVLSSRILDLNMGKSNILIDDGNGVLMLQEFYSCLYFDIPFFTGNKKQTLVLMKCSAKWTLEVKGCRRWRQAAPKYKRWIIGVLTLALVDLDCLDCKNGTISMWGRLKSWRKAYYERDDLVRPRRKRRCFIVLRWTSKHR